MQDTTATQTARFIALGTLFLIPLTPLLVADSYFFPFITGKAFYFRILVEILVCAWAVLALLNKNYRPRFSWLGVTVVAFVAWMFVADSFALNATKAFWSNFERMEGWVLLAHLLGFFYAAGAVLRAEEKWRAWVLSSLLVSVIVSGYAFLQINGLLTIHQGSVRVDATLGNSAYLAIYFLFNVFLALWLALTSERFWLKWSLLALALIEGVLIFFTQTRGTVLALVGALGLVALLTALTMGKRARQLALLGLVALVILVGGFIAAHDSAFVQNSPLLQRVGSISLADGQTRFTLWGMALEGLQERPVVGWGQEGFNYVFNTYYDPSLYTQEPWFDRAHNTFIDWLMAGGVPAFLLYLALFGTAIVLLWRSPEVSRVGRITLTGVLVGYAIHNFFVFDNLYSYIYFFAVLALIDATVARPIACLEEAPELSNEEGSVFLLPIAAVVAVGLIWTVNVPGMRVASDLILALSPSQKGFDGNIALFEDLAARPSFAAQEVREQIVSFAGSTVQSQSASNEQKQRAADLAVREMAKQVAAYPRDARGRLQLSYAYRAAGDAENALREVGEAAKLSPQKESIIIDKALLEWSIGDVQAAQRDFAAAYALGPQFPQLAVYAAAGYFAIGDAVAAEKILVSAYGTTVVDSDILSMTFVRTKDWPRLIALWKMRVKNAEADVKTMFGLASAYYAAGDRANAVQTIRDAVERYPDVAEAGAAAIAEIEGRK